MTVKIYATNIATKKMQLYLEDLSLFSERIIIAHLRVP